MSVMGDMLIFRESSDSSAELAELLPLRKMQASSNGHTIDIEAGSQKVSLQLDELLEAEIVLRELEAAKRFLDTAAERMASFREALNKTFRDRTLALAEGTLEVPTLHARMEPPKGSSAESCRHMGALAAAQMAHLVMVASLLTKLQKQDDNQQSYALAQNVEQEIPSLRHKFKTMDVRDAVAEVRAIKLVDAASDGDREGGQNRRSSLETWDQFDWSLRRSHDREAENRQLPEPEACSLTNTSRSLSPDSRTTASTARRSPLVAAPPVWHHWIGEDEPQVDSPKMAFLQLTTEPPAWHMQSSSTSPSRARVSPSRNADSPSRCRNAAAPALHDGWKAAA